ncbi:MAG: hypothetical protein ACREOQ_00720 [Gemmatimonadales bacterium]
MGTPTKLSHVRRLAASLTLAIAAAQGAAAQDAAQGTAAQFQGVERWDGVAKLVVDINLMGASKHRSKTVKFKLDKHRVDGTTETWQGKVKGNTKDEDSAGPFSADVVGGGDGDLTLTLGMNGDVARLDVHTAASKRKMRMKATGVTLQSMDVAQPARDTRTELPIPEDAESLVFGGDADNGGVRVKSVVTLTPNEIPLKAVLTAGSAVRGARAMLDGSRSKGRIRTFKWTLTPQGSSGAKATTFETRERTVQLVLLEDVKVDLEVSNGRKRSSTSGTAKVRPRQWATKFVQKRDDGVLEGERLVSEDAVPLAVNRFGQDACAVEGPGSGHGLHTTNPVTWKNDPGAGYMMQAVSDPDRPFDGYWYVKEQALIVERRALFNPDLMPGSPLFAQNAAKGTSEPFGRLVASTRAHEYMHGELMRRELARDDPATRIERLVEPGEDELATRADMEIRETETRLQEGEFHEQEVRSAMQKQFSKGGTVWVRDGRGGFASWTIASFADKAK